MLRMGENGALSFACAVHVDSNDKLRDFYSREMAKKLRAMSRVQKGDTTTDVSCQTSISAYIDMFIEHFGGGKPTTVLYHSIPPHPLLSKDTDDDDMYVIQQMFLHDGVCAAYLIQHSSHMVFYAYTHHHGSSLALKVYDNGDVSSCNTGDKHMFAFSFSC